MTTAEFDRAFIFVYGNTTSQIGGYWEQSHIASKLKHVDYEVFYDNAVYDILAKNTINTITNIFKKDTCTNASTDQRN